MDSRVMCLAALDEMAREYDLKEMIRIFGIEAVREALAAYGEKWGLSLDALP